MPAGPRTKAEVERVKGIEPSQPAWKAGALPLSYTRPRCLGRSGRSDRRPEDFLVEGAGFEPAYAMRADLQSAAFNHSATPPKGPALPRSKPGPAKRRSGK